VVWPNASDAKLPGHGYARTVMWQVLQTKALPDGSTFISFGLIETDATRAQWPNQSPVKIEMTIGKSLRVELITHNSGKQAFTLARHCTPTSTSAMWRR